MKKKTLFYYAFAAMMSLASLASCGDKDKDETSKPDNNTAQNQQPNNNPGDNPGNNTGNNPGNNPGNNNQTGGDNPSGLVPGKVELPATMTLDKASTPQDVLVAMGMGWNLGNQFDAHINGNGSETAWGQPKCTQATFTKVAAAGIKTVRIPITWGGNFGPAPDYKINETFMNRIAEVVGYAKNAGLNVILNIHHDGSADNKEKGPNFWLNIVKAAGIEEENQKITATFTAIWRQVAEKFKDEGEYLMFECFNEIHNGSWWDGSSAQYKTLNGWNQQVVNTVRAVGGKNATRWIGIPVYNTNINRAVEANCFVMPTDAANRLMVSVHFYEPVDYTLNYKFHVWGHKAGAGHDYDEKNVQTQLRKMFDKYTSKGVPVYIGEMGCVNRLDANEKFRLYYLEYVSKCMHDHLMPAILWDNGQPGAGSEKHGFFHHGTGDFQNDYSKPCIDALVKGMSNNDADYTLQSIYDKAPSK
ncbi:MAG: glycoside hydrolase family 5 protein [Bacteroidales bacterium]|nr:glycoside hydrolase family 5 protein [Bacteroidales bacterium]